MSKKSMILVFAIFSTILLIGANVEVMAHSASSLSLSYNSTTKELDVTINHVVGDPNSHFIITVEIKVNGSTVSNETYTSQPTANTFAYHYTNIIANLGATILVITVCNSFGTLSESIIVGAAAESVEPGIPGYLGFYIIVGISIIALLTMNYKKIRRINK